jgi:hypothetical protein
VVSLQAQKNSPNRSVVVANWTVPKRKITLLARKMPVEDVEKEREPAAEADYPAEVLPIIGSASLPNWLGSPECSTSGTTGSLVAMPNRGAAGCAPA